MSLLFIFLLYLPPSSSTILPFINPYLSYSSSSSASCPIYRIFPLSFTIYHPLPRNRPPIFHSSVSSLRLYSFYHLPSTNASTSSSFSPSVPSSPSSLPLFQWRRATTTFRRLLKIFRGVFVGAARKSVFCLVENAKPEEAIHWFVPV